MKKEIKIFFAAVMFFTRIPCPKWVDHSPEYLSKSSRYFSLVGIIVGVFGAVVYYGCSLLFPSAIALFLSMISTILITGAFHEDGLADVCDGFGGGWTKEKILLIMKDSRVGAFGAIGIMCALLLKYLCLLYSPAEFIPFILVAGHSISRFTASTLMLTYLHVRDEDSKAKPAANAMSINSFIISLCFAAIAFLLLMMFLPPQIKYLVLLTLVPVLLIRFYLGYYFKKWIGGITGDCGGATQQISEIIFYLSFLALWRFIYFDIHSH